MAGQTNAGTLSEQQWRLLGILSGLLGLIALILNLEFHPQAGIQGSALVLLACGSITFLRRWPITVLAVATVTASLEIATGIASLPVGTLLGLSSYFCVVRLPKRSAIHAGLVAMATLSAGILYARVLQANAPLGGDAIDGFFPLAAGWFVGESVASKRRYLEDQTEKERLAELERAHHEVREERVRIARELHDVVAHTIAVMTVQAGAGQRLFDKRPQEAKAALASIESVGQTAQQELEVVLGLLRDEGESSPLVPAPRLVDVMELIETVRASGIPVELRTSGLECSLLPALELSIYRVVQEALTNVVKHAPSARATVDLEVSTASVRIEVADDGGSREAPSGLDGSGHGHGIIGMRERLSAFGGSLVTESLPAGGFRVIGQVPIVGAP